MARAPRSGYGDPCHGLLHSNRKHFHPPETDLALHFHCRRLVGETHGDKLAVQHLRRAFLPDTYLASDLRKRFWPEFSPKPLLLSPLVAYAMETNVTIAVSSSRLVRIQSPDTL